MGRLQIGDVFAFWYIAFRVRLTVRVLLSILTHIVHAYSQFRRDHR